MHKQCAVCGRNFNSRPSARGDQNGRIGYTMELISIHAPPRGATVVVVVNPAVEGISIHAPPRGATALAAAGVLWRALFQFTPLAEGRELKLHVCTLPIPMLPCRPSRRGVN